MRSIKDKVESVTGRLKIEKRNAQGVVTQEMEVPNLVVNDGLEYIAARMVDQGTDGNTHPLEMTLMSLGSNGGHGPSATSATTPAGIDSALRTEHGSKKALTSATVSGQTVTYVATFGGTEATGFDHTVEQQGADNTNNNEGQLNGYSGAYDSGKDGSIKEAGIFNSGGTMLCRTVFLPVNKEDGDSITITWVITIN
jgi:hypothetical protein